MAVSRTDVQSGVDRDLFVAGVGHMRGWPTRPGTSSAATTGVPTNAIAGFGPGAIFQNFKGSIGSLVYVNTGTNTSTTWVNIV